FADSEDVFAGPTATILDDRYDYGEERFVTFGLLADRVVAVTHTEATDTIRIISIRKATRREQKLFFQTIQGNSN
ncbi:MAG: BrnT family toxin, partial [Sulfurifustis sp.]